MTESSSAALAMLTAMGAAEMGRPPGYQTRSPTAMAYPRSPIPSETFSRIFFDRCRRSGCTPDEHHPVLTGAGGPNSPAETRAAMPRAVGCPEELVLERLVLGRIFGAEAEALE